MGRNAEIGRALENVQMAGLLSHLRNDLNTRGARADDADALASEIDAFTRPLCRVVPLARELLDAGEGRQTNCRQATGGHDAISGGVLTAVVRGHFPFAGGFIEMRRRDAGFQLDVAAQIEAVGDVVQVRQNFRLSGIAFRPLPFLLERFVEGVAVLHAFHVATCTRIAVPEPGTTNAITRLEDPDAQALLTQPVQQVETRKTSTDDDGVVVAVSRVGKRVAFTHGSSRWLARCG